MMAGQHRHFLREARATPTSYLVLSAVTVVLAAVALGFVLWPESEDDTAAESTETAEAESTATAEATEEPTESPETPEPTPEPDEGRDIGVIVYNRTSVVGLAADRAADAEEAGWEVVDTSDWSGGNIPSDTVYHPEGEEDSANLLAEDLGIERVMPRVDPMPADLLAVILVSEG